MSGRHFLQIPGPTNIPERILRAMDRASIDHRGPELPPIVEEIVRRFKEIFATTRAEIVIYPTSGTGASEAAIVNTLNPGDRALAFNIGHFSHLYAECARRHGVAVDELDLPWDRGVSTEMVHERLAHDSGHEYRAVLLVHNESATGVTSDVSAIRRAIDAARHPALLLVDAISALGSMDFQFDQWGIDVAIVGSQKGLMMPPGLGILCVSPRALEVSSRVTSPRYFFDWTMALDQMHQGYFPYTPAVNLLFGLQESLRILQEEGLANVIARHRRLSEGVRRAITSLGLGILCRRPEEYSNSVTAVVVPEDKDATEVVRAAVTHLDLSLGWGLARLRNKVFRIGHLGALNELEVLATIAGVEMACELAGIHVPLGQGVTVCERYFMEHRTAPITP
ncbi:MAG TPA: aminotransferase class V-fold PLP-dependent enzyme [bacterium]|nr:aminotransferase class V-fold PLP-dependent enzyme [bacterium]